MAKRIKIHDLVNSDNTVSVISHQLRINNEMAGEGEVKVFNLDKLHPNIFNPRKINFTMADIQELAQAKPNYEQVIESKSEDIQSQLTELVALASNIEQSGLLQPIVVTDHPTIPDEYMVVAGERRYWSHVLLGRTVIRAVYRMVDEQSHRVLSLAENLARHDLSLKEKIIGLKDLIAMDKEFTKVDHVMRLFGVRKSAAYLLLKVIKDQEQFDAVMDGTISQFRDIENFSKSKNPPNNINPVDDFPTVGKKRIRIDDSYLTLNLDQTKQLAKKLGIDPERNNLKDALLELLA